MTYPRELNLGEDIENALRMYLDTELINHYHERGRFMDELNRMQRDYWAEPRTERATWPFVGAATIVIPLSAIAIEAVHARVMTTMFALDRFVSASPVSDDWEDAARPVESFLSDELLLRMDFRNRIDSTLMEAEKFGNCIGKVGYVRDIRRGLRTNEAGKDEEFIVTQRQGATFDQVSIGRFLMPYYAVDPQTSPWVGEEHSETPLWVLQAEQSGLFREGTYEAIKAWVSLSQTGTTGMERKFENQQMELEKKEPLWPHRLDWQEVWLSYNVDGGTMPTEIMVHYHMASRTFMSIRANYNTDLRRPYRIGKYFPIENRWTAIGICKQNEQFQREITTQHRQRLDNATLANMRMFKIHRLSGYGPKEPVFPGKMWFVDDMTHVDTVQLGEIYNSSYNNEQASLTYSQQRTGVNELTLGMQQVGTPGTATSDLARIQEGNKKFDYIYDNFSSFVDQIICDTAVTIQQFGPRNVQYYEVAASGDKVRKFFQVPATLIKDGLLLRLNRSTQQHNEILQRQNWTQIAQILQQYYTGLINLAEVTQQPQILQMIAGRGMQAATEAMMQLLETFDIRNVDRIILKELLTQGGLVSLQGGPSGQPVQPRLISGGAQPAPGAVTPPFVAPSASPAGAFIPGGSPGGATIPNGGPGI